MEDTTPKPVNAGTRLGAMLLDHFLMTIIIMLIATPGLVANTMKHINMAQKVADPPFTFGGAYLYIGFFAFSLYFCKDCFQGRSLAKRMLKLQVVNNKTGLAAGPLRCLVRDLFIVIWPVEAIVALANPSRRIGDFVAGTKLVRYDATQVRPKINFLQVLVSMVLAYGFLFLIMLPFKALSGGSGVTIVESSYNDKESKAAEKLIADSVGQYATAKIKVFDTIEGKPLKYLSVIFTLKVKPTEDYDEYGLLNSKAIPLLYSMFPKNTCMGYVNYYFDGEGIQHSGGFRIGVKR